MEENQLNCDDNFCRGVDDCPLEEYQDCQFNPANIRSRKELLYLNIKDITEGEKDRLGDIELNCCDKCGEIDSTYRLNWIDGEDFLGNSVVLKLIKEGNVAICNDCLEKEEKTFPDK